MFFFHWQKPSNFSNKSILISFENHSDCSFTFKNFPGKHPPDPLHWGEAVSSWSPSFNRYLSDGGVDTFLTMTICRVSTFLPIFFGRAEPSSNFRNAFAPAPLYSNVSVNSKPDHPPPDSYF